MDFRNKKKQKAIVISSLSVKDFEEKLIYFLNNNKVEDVQFSTHYDNDNNCSMYSALVIFEVEEKIQETKTRSFGIIDISQIKPCSEETNTTKSIKGEVNG